MKRDLYRLLACSLVVGCFLNIVACGESQLSRSEYLSYLADMDNGLKKQREVEGIRITAMLLPAEFRSERLVNPESADSTIAFSFAISLSNDGRDVATSNVRTVQEFLERVTYLNFSLSSDLNLQLGQATLNPVLCSMDNTYGLESERRFTVVFAPTEATLDEFFKSPIIQLVYSDDVFGVGTQKFQFDRRDLQAVPKLKK